MAARITPRDADVFGVMESARRRLSGFEVPEQFLVGHRD
jgi:hypothetical protein